MAAKFQKRYTEEDLPVPGLFEEQQPAGGPLTVFQAQLLSSIQTDWTGLVSGFEKLQAITFSSSLAFLFRIVERFANAEIVLGSERILSRQHLVLTQTSQIVEEYGIADALADHKALTEALASQLDAEARSLLPRVLDGSLRFRLLRGRPSHEKLYLLSGATGSLVVTGSANLTWQAFGAWQHEIYIA